MSAPTVAQEGSGLDASASVTITPDTPIPAGHIVAVFGSARVFSATGFDSGAPSIRFSFFNGVTSIDSQIMPDNIASPFVRYGYVDGFGTGKNQSAALRVFVATDTITSIVVHQESVPHPDLASKVTAGWFVDLTVADGPIIPVSASGATVSAPGETADAITVSAPRDPRPYLQLGFSLAIPPHFDASYPAPDPGSGWSTNDAGWPFDTVSNATLEWSAVGTDAATFTAHTGDGDGRYATFGLVVVSPVHVFSGGPSGDLLSRPTSSGTFLAALPPPPPVNVVVTLGIQSGGGFDYGTDIRGVADSDELWTEVSGPELVAQDALHAITQDDFLGPGGDGRGFDVRRLIGSKQRDLIAFQPILAEVIERDDRVSRAEVTLTETSHNGLLDVQIGIRALLIGGETFEFTAYVSDLASQGNTIAVEAERTGLS